MIIELPEKFSYGNQARIEDGILKIPSGVSWREFIYKLTIAAKGKKCWYCGKPLKKEEITLDHLYPQDLGGPTVPNNLAPTCSDCNNRKGNLTEKQYRQILQAPEEKRKIIKSRMVKSNEYYKEKHGYYLPKEWITSQTIENVLVTMIMSESYYGRKYGKIETFYMQYEHLPYPIVVDRNNYLLDGFLVLIYAKNNSISKIPTIVLENVEVVFNR